MLDLSKHGIHFRLDFIISFKSERKCNHRNFLRKFVTKNEEEENTGYTVERKLNEPFVNSAFVT